MASETLLETMVAIYEGVLGRLALDNSASRRELAKAASVVLIRLLARKE